jgi:3-oxoacyl-[acyl-carrier protein] reductase
MGDLNTKRALVTAGGQGIGLAISRELVARGCDVAVSYRSSKGGAEQLVSEAEAAGRRALAIQADLTIEADAKRLVADAVEFLSGLDVLVNNCGDLVERRWLADIDLDFLQKVMDVNVTSMVMVTREAAEHLAAVGQSSVVNLSSLAGRKGGHGGSVVYATSKGAVLTWTRALAGDLGHKGIRVNAVAPGLIFGSQFHEVHTTEESKARTIGSIPLGRAGTCEDVARAVAFLASEYDGFITGATLDINGGVYCA